MTSSTTHSKIDDDTANEVTKLIIESLKNPVREKQNENK